jgi:copper homeostasis protein
VTSLRDSVEVSDSSEDTRSLLEVIAISPEDAVAAELGGADRLEIVSEIRVGGLTPSLEQFLAIREAVKIPLRVMLRTNGGFVVSVEELEALSNQIVELRNAGADQFVFGFLDESGALDLNALNIISEAVNPCCWTLHHAFDHANEQRAAWDSAECLLNLDCILSGGVRGDLSLGLETLCERAGWQTEALGWLAGGGLILERVAPLRGAGIRRFHIGRAARFGYSWDQPVSRENVLGWRRALDGN